MMPHRKTSVQAAYLDAAQNTRGVFRRSVEAARKRLDEIEQEKSARKAAAAGRRQEARHGDPPR
jgi:hypothetical protein